MLVAGEDPRFVARRLMILASEDIGMADPTALQTAVAAAQTVQLIGLPEAALTLAHATVHLAPGAEVERRHHRARRGMDDIRAGKADWCRPICATATMRARQSWAMPSATGIRTTTRMALCRNNIRLTSW